MKRLAIGEVVVDVDPDRGAEVTSLRYGGRELLARTPWPPAPVVPGADEAAWTRAWRGGWQILFPNAGGPGEADGVRHCFHGGSSQAKWEVYESARDVAAFSWADEQGLLLIRWFRLSERGVLVQTNALNTSRESRAAVAVEHLVLGGDLLARGARVDPYDASGEVEILPLTPEGDPAGEPRAWPHGPEGRDWSVVPAAGPAARFGVVRGLATPRVQVANEDLAVVVSWDDSALPYLWYWLELEARTGDPWEGRTRALGIEPASVGHAQGITQAVQEGAARMIPPGASWSWHVELTFVPR
ncbi:hypothetical protein LI90_3887 [Carbonactinospora thermoautotrophica]|uniref:Uncharacterized protein n=1 Tax=Carbonactinospora thermoautotrophica TaxID=1469144 RepID=A0A132MYT1_9ACTN|nr:hypothetical protein [Carbonactinospora thermoautotrophica]KWX02840.1 hypothetical protein LI90_3887 [Carbonactinospora thermoautotrophica]